MRAIIAGAGIGGLATAMALSRAGLDVTIHERSERLEEFGAGLQLTPNATRVLSRLGALEFVSALATTPTSICVLRGSDDHVLTRMPLDNAERRWGAPYLTIHRADLQRALAEVVLRQRNAELKLGSTVLNAASHRDRVAVGLENGSATSEDSADLLIAADGLRSRLREHSRLLDVDDLLCTGGIAFRATVDVGLVDPRWRGREVCLRIGPNAHLVHYLLRAKSVLNIVAVIKSVWRGATDDRPWDGAADTKTLDRAFESWSKATRDLLAAASVWRAWPIYVRAPLSSFSLGRIVFVGDAAHPMAPYLAQGAGQAIEDAGALGQIFSRRQSIAEGLFAYSRERVARATRVQREAQRQGRIYHLSGPMALARDTAIRLLGPQRLSDRYDWLYGA